MDLASGCTVVHELDLCVHFANKDQDLLKSHKKPVLWESLLTRWWEEVIESSDGKEHWAEDSVGRPPYLDKLQDFFLQR